MHRSDNHYHAIVATNIRFHYIPLGKFASWIVSLRQIEHAGLLVSLHLCLYHFRFQLNFLELSMNDYTMTDY